MINSLLTISVILLTAVGGILLPNHHPEIPIGNIPSAKEIILVAKTIHGEAGICDEMQKAAVAWCICNRVDCADFPNTIEEVVTQPNQFKGYSEEKEPTEDEYRIAEEVLTKWMNGSEDRVLPKRFLFFHSNKKGKNIFTTNHLKGETWKN